MTELKFEEFKIRGRRIGRASWFPALRELIESSIKSEVDEDDGLFVGYGTFSDGLPYTLQDDYDAPEEELQFKSVILENEYLKVTFLPEVGGRIWSIYDKENKRDLVLGNDKFLPGNLAIRNAWLAGGVEFNCGRRGHDEQTVSPRFAAVIRTAEFSVLRFYEYQRDRGTPFQYDCFLPSGSRFLFVRGRIWNPNRHLVPMYWWSNIAVPEVKGARVVTPAAHTFANRYDGASHVMEKLSMPDGEGFDASYPTNFPTAKDHFYNIPEDTRRYECIFYPDGYGFCHVSTKRLRGRKLFVWGQGTGGRNWNRKLLGPSHDAYVEVQAGLGRTQLESLPMPPRTAWEWLEGYGALVMEPDKVFGEWEEAIKNTTDAIDRLIPAQELEEMLRETKEPVALKKGEVFCAGSGWGALEERRAGEKLTGHLDFGDTDEEQKQWVELLDKNRISDKFPCSYLVDEPWFNLLKKATPSWQTNYHIALNFIRRGDLERAEKALDAAGSPQGNRHLLHAWANLRRRQSRVDEAANYICQAARIDLTDKSFVKEALKMLCDLRTFDKLAGLAKELPEEIASLPLMRLMIAVALAHTGEIEKAAEILAHTSLMDIPDIREGENIVSDLYLFIRKAQAEREGRGFDVRKVEIPRQFDTRMS